MSPVEEAVVRRKLAVIVENLKALNEISGMSAEEYAGDIFRRKAAERLLQELIEAAVDINMHIIVQTGNRAPDDYYQSFTRMGEIGAIAADLAEKLAPSAGLRNRLVHEYDFIENALVLEAVRKADDLYSRYVGEIERYLRGSAVPPRSFPVS